ncbi:MAG: hypothetical protein H6713_18210 [Myxococcales bacterium]|nr:hypothetical protein [Myxococcales bacterium]MCB9751912.1 hypothetical protein [Myxococcales bacterium]
MSQGELETLALPPRARELLDKLPEPARVELLALIERAAQRKHDRLSAALEDVVALVPRPLRRSARKLLT